MKKNPNAGRRSKATQRIDPFELGATVIAHARGKSGAPWAALSRAHAKELLKMLMEHISEEQFAAGWLVGLEYVLWGELQKPPRRRKRGSHVVLLPFEREGLKFLAQAAGGWSTMDRFVPMKQWLVLYAKHEVEERRKSNAVGQRELDPAGRPKTGRELAALWPKRPVLGPDEATRFDRNMADSRNRFGTLASKAIRAAEAWAIKNRTALKGVSHGSFEKYAKE